jgi:Domain of unknown function (DUF4349)/Putative zinc-finger
MKHDVAELLPFYANGTLEAADRARVEAELATCADCSEELHELQSLGTTLRARAEAAPPPPAHLLDAVLARLDTPASPAGSATRAARSSPLHASWWAVPARYAAATALVVGFGAAAVAGWHARVADSAHDTVGNGSAETQMQTVYRVTPGPSHDDNALRAPVPAQQAAKVKIDTAQRPAAAAGPTVEKQHRLAKHARLEIYVGDVEAALRSAQSTVRAAGGDVTSLDDASPRTAGAVHGAELAVEVPADRLDATLDALAKLGPVRNRTITADDLGDAIVDEEARLTNLRRAERDLRALMDHGGKVDEILTVQQNLSEVRGQIEQLAAQHQHDLHRVATSAIALSLSEDRPNPSPAKPGPTARIDGAWHAGLNALADTAVAVISAVVWSVAYAPIPLALAGLAYALARRIRPASLSR